MVEQLISSQRPLSQVRMMFDDNSPRVTPPHYPPSYSFSNTACSHASTPSSSPSLNYPYAVPGDFELDVQDLLLLASEHVPHTMRTSEDHKSLSSFQISQLPVMETLFIELQDKQSLLSHAGCHAFAFESDVPPTRTPHAPPPPDPNEPENTAEAISRWGLGYIVLTSVDHDDPIDSGAHHFASTIQKIKQKARHILVEALTGNFAGSMEHVSLVAESGLDVYAHNVETVEALTPFVRGRRATFRQSLKVLQQAKKEGVRVINTIIMLGIGENEEQVLDALKELRKADVDVVIFGDIGERGLWVRNFTFVCP